MKIKNEVKEKNPNKILYIKYAILVAISLILVTYLIVNDVMKVNAEESEEPQSYQYDLLYWTESNEAWVSKTIYSLTIVSDTQIVAVRGNTGSFEYYNGTQSATEYTFYTLTGENAISNGRHTRFQGGSMYDESTITDSSFQTYNINSSSTYTVPYYSRFETDIPTFDTKEHAYNYLMTGSTGGQLNRESSETYDMDIPKPVVHSVDNLWKMDFDNAIDGYYMEIQGRWRTIEDITPYKESLVWHYDYDSVINGDMFSFVSMESRTQAGEFDIDALKGQSVNQFLRNYPVDDRNIYSNDVSGNVMGYTEAVRQLKFLLGVPSNYLKPELYIRYYVIDENGDIQYGKWCHVAFNLGKSGSSGTITSSPDVYDVNISDKGLTDQDRSELEATGDSALNDTDLRPNTQSDIYPDELSFQIDFLKGLKSFEDSIKDYTLLLARIASFLPSWIWDYVGYGIIALLAVAIFMKK